MSLPNPIPIGDPPPAAPALNPWHARAEELADWALARFFVRTDRYGGYYRFGGELRKCAFPKEGAVPNAVTRGRVLRHFRATRAEDVCGAFSLAPGPNCVGRAVAVDIDAHGADADPDRNARYAVHLYGELGARGFRPLLARWGGSCHLYALFASDVPGPELHAFGRALVSGSAGFGLPAVETFPKQPGVPVGGYGNWLRVVGRHPLRDQWADVYDGARWLAGAPAVAHVLSLTGDAAAVEGARIEAPRPPTVSISPEPRPEPDVLSEYSRSVTLDEVARWHEAAGHRVARRRGDRVEFVRAGKAGGASFNVALCSGVPITYNFSPNAGLPDGKGLTPAQVRCFYECGRCDAPTLTRFADGLRAALGLPARRPKEAGADAPAERVSRLEWALAQAEERIERLEWALACAEQRIGGNRVAR